MIMSKKHSMKTVETSWLMRSSKRQSKTQTKEKQTNGDSISAISGNNSTKDQFRLPSSGTEKEKTSQNSASKIPRFRQKQVQKMESKLAPVPVLITISPSEEADITRESLDKMRSNRDSSEDEESIENSLLRTDLKKIMDNFITITTAENPEIGNANVPDKMSKGDDLLCLSKADQTACVDFGIADYLCNFKREDDNDEIEVDISSDTDSNFMAATPPNRFSDSDCDGIEPISITLETSLNPSKGFIHHQIDNRPTTQGDRPWTPELNKLIPRRRPFRRHISLPPSIFMSRFFGNNGTNSPTLLTQQKEMTLILKSTGLVKAAAAAALATGKDGPFHFPRINRLESISSCDMENTSEHLIWTKSTSTWSMSIDSANGGSEYEDISEQEGAFTSDIERRAFLVRSMRRLVRQDTTVGNFAPPHFRNSEECS